MLAATAENDTPGTADGDAMDMNSGSVALFSVALGIAQATPGPATMTLVSRVVARGPAGAGVFCAGLMVGELFWFLCALFGVAALIAKAEPLFIAMRVLAACYLLYLARRLWTSEAGTRIDGGGVEGHNGLAVTGISVALANPKTMLFYLALAPTILPVGVAAPSSGTVAMLGALVLAIYGAVLAAYTGLAAQARHLLQSPRALRAINRISSAVLAVTALFVLLH